MTTRAEPLILCKSCFDTTSPKTVDDVESITCNTEVFGNITTLRCKSCNNVVYTVIDHGVVSFSDEEED